jgi:rubrerythrin
MDNLWAAFAGESQANRKYLAFAKKAEEEGFSQIAKLFKAAAEAETVHAHAHLRVLGEVKGTLDNLKAAMAGESHEFHTMYPEFLKLAEQEGNKGAITSFKYALAVEKTHFELYEKAFKSLESGKDLPKADIFVCPICGHTEEGHAPDKCPVCGVAKDKFTKVQ